MSVRRIGVPLTPISNPNVGNALERFLSGVSRPEAWFDGKVDAVWDLQKFPDSLIFAYSTNSGDGNGAKTVTYDDVNDLQVPDNQLWVLKSWYCFGSNIDVSALRVKNAASSQIMTLGVQAAASDMLLENVPFTVPSNWKFEYQAENDSGADVMYNIMMFDSYFVKLDVVLY